MAEGNATIHAAGGLVAEFFFLHVEMEFIPVANALYRWAVQRQFTEVLDKSCGFAHVKFNLSQRRGKSSLRFSAPSASLRQVPGSSA
jgi:hypothetical protein